MTKRPVAVAAVVAASVLSAMNARSAPPSVTAPANGRPMAIGVNLDFNSDHATAAPWVNVRRLFRRWGKVGRPWEEEPNLRLSADGYPLADAEALTFLYGYPEGRYRLGYRGTGQVTIGGIGRMASKPIRAGGKTSAYVDVRGIGPDQMLTLRIERVDPKDPVRDLRLVPPGYDLETKDVYTQAFLRRLRPFSTLRFMDWTMTNASPVVKWTDRTGPDAFLATGPTGVAYEDIVALANATGKDIWINIPDQANDDFVTRLARLLRQGLKPGTNVYVEYSNELWNTVFAQYARNVAAARANGRLTTSDDFGRAGEQAAFKTAAIAAIFRREFGLESARVRPVFCGQAANAYFLERGLAYLKAKQGDPAKILAAVSVAPYVAIDPKADRPRMTKDALFEALQEYLDGTLAGWIAKNAELARTYKLPLVAYEGGQHLVAFNPLAGADVNEALKLEAQDDPRMGRLLEDLASTWSRLGGSLLCHYTHVGPYSKWGYWGLLPDINRAGGPKWDAVMRLALPAGDATLDGTVDFADFTVLRDHWNRRNQWWEQGDFDGNGAVDAADLGLLKGRLTGLSAAQQRQVAAFPPR